MRNNDETLIIQNITEERLQGHTTRRHLYTDIGQRIGLPVVSFFTSFVYAVTIEDDDANMLEGVLQKCDLSQGFALFLSSPGGSGLAAERIINICRSYSGTGHYITIVPGKAKSAATMICLGSSKIMMGKTSELGSIDPQIALEEDGRVKWWSVYNIVKSYRNLFEKAVREKGNLQPYLQQLSNYDEREIAHFEAAMALSEDIAIKTLKSGMLSKLSSSRIKEKIKRFLTPEEVKVHGRPIYAEEAKNCGLNVELTDLQSELWSPIYELYARLNSCVSSENVAKCIECEHYSFRAKVRGAS